MGDLKVAAHVQLDTQAPITPTEAMQGKAYYTLLTTKCYHWCNKGTCVFQRAIEYNITDRDLTMHGNV